MWETNYESIQDAGSIGIWWLYYYTFTVTLVSLMAVIRLLLFLRERNNEGLSRE